MGRFVRGAAALILGTTLTSVAAAQTGSTPAKGTRSAARGVPGPASHATGEAGSSADRQRRDCE